MYFAIDKVTGKTITADAAAVRRWAGRRYVCPCCGKPVLLRVGSRISTYFAHRAHVASPDCENYHPGGDYEGGGRGVYVPPPRPLSLYLAIENPESSRSPWRIELLVPRSPDSRGLVFVPAGNTGTIPVACARLKESGRRIPVRLLTDPYQLRVTDEVDPEYRRKVSVITPGFATDTAHAFRYTESGGRRIDAGRPLYWGRGYYLLWPESLPNEWPKTVWREQLVDSGAWHCARIELPAEPSEAVANWAAHLLDRDVERPPVTLSLVSPASARRLEDDSIVVCSDSDIVVGIIGDLGSAMPSTLRLTTAATRHAALLPLPGRNPILVSLERLPLGLASVEIDDDDETELTLNVVPQLRAPTLTGPTLHFNKDSKAISLPTYSIAAEVALDAVRKGDAALRGVSVPARMAVKLSTRPGRRSEWSERALEWNVEQFTTQPVTYPLQFEQEILSAVCDAVGSPNEVDLDFGNFGSLVLSALVTHSERSRETRLSDPLRRRIQWLSLLPTGRGDGRLMIPVPELNRAAHRLLGPPWAVNNPGDRLWLSQLCQRQSWIPEVVPQVRELAAALHKLCRLAP